MSDRPWYKRYPSDFITGAIGLTAEQKGVYSTLLDLMYDRQRPITDDPIELGRICGCSTRRFKTIRTQLAEREKIILRDGLISNSRFEKQIASEKPDENDGKIPEKTSQLEAADNEINHLESPIQRLEARDQKEPSKQLIPESETHIRPVAKATRPDAGKVFDLEFWPAYPKREGENPKKPARKAFIVAVKSGHDPTAIVAGAKHYAAEMQRIKHVGTRYVAQAVTWLHQARWEDHQQTAPPNGEPAYLQAPTGMPSLDEIRATYGQPHATTD